jgi:Rrf2 family protein
VPWRENDVVNLSAKVEYACIAVLELATRYSDGEPVRLRTIAETHGIPSPFLVQIMLQLKSAGLVESTRGSAGGYRLVRDPHSITLTAVKEVIDGPTGSLASNLADATSVSRVLLEAWQHIDEAERQLMSEVTLGDLVDRVRGRTEKMYYI